jgi:hypothetical protein
MAAVVYRLVFKPVDSFLMKKAWGGGSIPPSCPLFYILLKYNYCIVTTKAKSLYTSYVFQLT